MEKGLRLENSAPEKNRHRSIFRGGVHYLVARLNRASSDEVAEEWLEAAFDTD